MRLLKNKKGIELSVNFIVLLILAIAVFAGGLVFTSKFFGQAEKMRTTLDSQTEKQIEKLLDSGSPVVLPISTKQIFRKKFDTFAVGILADETAEFELNVEFENGFTKTNEEIIGASAGNWIQQNPQMISLKKHEKGKLLIGVEVPKDAEKGTYIFNIKVFKNDEADPYDNPLQMIVKVP